MATLLRSQQPTGITGRGMLHLALESRRAKHGPPEIMNSDQGSQFTGHDWTITLSEAGVKISMDGRGRWIDSRMIERLWRSVKYECVYLNAFERGSEARAGIGRWIAITTPNARIRPMEN